MIALERKKKIECQVGEGPLLTPCARSEIPGHLAHWTGYGETSYDRATRSHRA
jgi:hypothetical protein